MAEFSSKKLLQPQLVTTPESPSHGADNVTQWLTELASSGVQCLIRTQEVSQDFVTYGRSSRTKTLWIGIILLVIPLFLLWLWLRRIRL